MATRPLTRDRSNEAVPAAHCLDANFATKLWEKSEEWTGLKQQSNL
jgi:hypothetical protein